MKLIRPRASHPNGKPGKWHIIDAHNRTSRVRTECGWSPRFEGEIINLETEKYETFGHIPTLLGTGTIDGYCRRCGFRHDRFMNWGRVYDFDSVRMKVMEIVRRKAWEGKNRVRT